AAETARVGVAIAELYPRVDIAASFGLQSLSLGDLLSSNAQQWSIGPQTSWNIFNFGALRSSVGAQQARVRQQLARYEQALFISVEEVESAMATQRRERIRAQALGRAQVAFAESVRLSEELYRSGQTTFQNVLDAQRSLLDTEDQLAVSEAAIASSSVDLYLALGGSWDPGQDFLRGTLPERRQ
ncbi:MAG: TolC family protein, partial [Planctomycetota bacterium]